VIVAFLLLGAGVGAALALTVSGLVPARPSLAVAIDTLQRPPAMLPARSRLVAALVAPLRQLGLPRASTRKDLAALGRDSTAYLATQAGIGGIGLLAPAATIAGLNAMGADIAWSVPLWLGLLLAAGGFVVTDLPLHEEAEDRRLSMRHTLAALLDVVPPALAAGAGVEQALGDATGIADGWAADRIRQALTTARLTRAPIWQPLHDLGEQTGVVQLQQLASSLRLASGEGARIRQALLARGDALSERLTTDMLTRAEAATERMSIPLMTLTTIFLLFLVYPEPVISPIQAVAALLIAGLSTGPAVVVGMGPLPVPPAVVQTLPNAAAGPQMLMPAAASATEARPGADRSVNRHSSAVVSGVMSDPASIEPHVRRLPRFAATTGDGPMLVQVGQHRYTVTVTRGETLWDIAGAWLGDHSRWPEIYQLNRDRYDHYGRMKGGDHIEPTWVLVLPIDARPPAGSRPGPPPAQAEPPSQQPVPPPPGPSAPASTAPPSATPTHPDDGVVAPVPSPTGSGSTGSAAGSPTPTATHSPSSRSPRANPPGIALPGGSWVDLGLAAAIAAAASLVWIHRRRRYRPRPPSPQLRLDDPDLAPLPPVVTDIRLGLRRTAVPTPADGDDTEELAMVQPPADPEPAGQSETAADTGAQDEPASMPVAPSLDHPLLHTWPPAGLGLLGPGAEAAARGFLVAALSADGQREPEARTRVVIPASTLATLLGTHAVTVADTVRLTVTTGLPEALDLLEEQTLHRTRLVFDHEVDDVAALRETDPAEEPLPAVLLVADTLAAHERTRIAAVLTQGQRLDIHGVLLGAWPAGDTVVVADDGSTSRAGGDRVRHGGHPADVGRLAVLDPTQTTDLLRTLAEAHTGVAQPAAPVEPAPPAATTLSAVGFAATAGDTGQPADTDIPTNEKRAASAQPAPPASGSYAAAGHALEEDQRTVPAASARDADSADVALAVDAEAEDSTDPDDDGSDTDIGDSEAGGLAAPERTGPARVVVLGVPRIVDLPPPRKPGEQPLRSKALEVLAYLVASGGQAPQHRIIADVLAAERRSKSRARLNTYVSNLRGCLARSGGRASYVAGPDAQYALNRDVIDVDLWRMQAAIAAAQAAGNDKEARVAALRAAVACYTGPLAEGRDYEWVEPYREAARQQAVDTHLGLVAALGDDDPAEAVTVLRAAIDHDPHNEALYQQAMRLYARQRDVDGIRDLRRALTRRMADIDTEPADDTIALADRLVTDLQRRPRGPSRLPRDAA
jgi:DNA-binding SARP family transcriptional activator/nucleoid-associated protein YgaU